MISVGIDVSKGKSTGCILNIKIEQKVFLDGQLNIFYVTVRNIQ